MWEYIMRSVDTVLINGRLHAKGDNTPFTGTITDYHFNGNKRYVCGYANGHMQGFQGGWYENGHGIYGYYHGKDNKLGHRMNS